MRRKRWLIVAVVVAVAAGWVVLAVTVVAGEAQEIRRLLGD